jgi:hypothetical protein
MQLPINRSNQDQRHFAPGTTALLLAAFACLLIGAKWMLIHTYGNPTPYWDQWDAEADRLYAPYLAGKLQWLSLGDAHNEHYIVTTRLMALLLFVVNGQWNPLLQMLVNAVLHAVALVYLLCLLRRLVPGIVSAPSLLAALVLFCLPYAWENTLAGFQTQFYFNLFFSFAALWFLVIEMPLSSRWWWGVALAVLAFLSLASGIFAVGAAAAILFLRGPSRDALSGGAETSRWLAAIGVLAALFVVGYWLTPVIPTHAFLKASSPALFLQALLQGLSWPLKGSLVRAILLHAPAIGFTYVLLRHRRAARPAEWFMLALLAWVFGQALATSYGRAIAVLAPRYLDLLAIGILANFACLLWFLDRVTKPGRIVVRIAIVLWLGLVAVGMYRQWPIMTAEIEHKRQIGLAEQANVTGFLSTGDKSYIEGKPFLETPYPDAARLMRLLSDPEIRTILPAAVVPDNVTERRAGRLDETVAVLLAHAYVPLIAGVLLCVAAALTRSRKQDGAAEAERRNKQEMHG